MLSNKTFDLFIHPFKVFSWVNIHTRQQIHTARLMGFLILVYFPCMGGDELGSPPHQIGDLSFGPALTRVLGTGSLSNYGLVKKKHTKQKEEMK